MKRVVGFLAEKDLVFRSFERIEPSALKSRKKLEIYSGVDEKGFYASVFKITRKSRFVRKNAAEIMDLEQKLESFIGHSYKYKYLLIASPLCSQAKEFMMKHRWKVYKVENDTL